ncbi:unnamed protein product [Durusdinium trenchii]|uniref:Uncharacterized protein n=1 Tax=Durusdinium trenchii TaxID=1381693 RepID=A0ABP0RVG0_9DINO
MKTKKTILKLTRVPDTAAAVTTETKSAAAVLPNRSSASRVDKFIVNPKPKTQAQKKKRWDGVCGFMDGYISSPSPPSDESDSESSSDSDPDSGNGNGPCDPTQAETEYYSPTRSPVNLTDKSHPTCDEDITPWQPSPDYTTVASDHSPTIPMPRDSIVGPSMPTVPEEGSTRHDDTPGPEAGMPVVNPDPVVLKALQHVLMLLAGSGRRVSPEPSTTLFDIVLRLSGCGDTRHLSLEVEQLQAELVANSGSTRALLDWVADRAAGDQQRVGFEILRALADMNLYKQMRCAGHCYPPADVNYLLDDAELVEVATKFAVELAANTSWAQMLYTMTLPLACGTLLSQKKADRVSCLKHLRVLVESILKAEDWVMRKPLLDLVLTDLAYHEEPLVREIMALLTQGNFDLNSAEIKSAQKLALRMFSSTWSTKEILESTFAHLTDLITKSNKNKRMNSFLLWLYTTTSSYIKASGMSQALPDAAVWADYIRSFGIQTSPMMRLFNKAFNVSAGFTMPDSPDINFPKSAKGVLKQGCLLQRGAIFLHRDQDEFFLSLGFIKWCCIGTKLTLVEVGDEETEFLTMPDEWEGIEVMFNFDVAEGQGPWRRVLVQNVPPACLPAALHSVGTAFLITSKNEWLLRGAVREGCQLNVEQLKSVCSSLKVPLPGNGEGSGKRGGVVKKDYAAKLIKYLFPDAPEVEFNNMLLAMMGWTKMPTDLDVLAAVSELDLANADAFEHVRKHALNTFEENLFGKGQAHGIEEAENETKRKEMKAKADEKAKKLKEEKETTEKAERKKNFELTPPDLKLLLPGNGSIKTVFWARYHPTKGFFRFDYPTGDLFVLISILFCGAQLATECNDIDNTRKWFC